MRETIYEKKYSGEFFVPGISPKIIEEEHFERYKFAAKYAHGKRILDIACGVGYGSKILIEAGASSVLGCDILEDNIKNAIDQYKSDNLEFKVKDATKPLLEGKFDLIACFETIEHIDDFKTTLNNFYESLMPDGQLIISSPNRKITEPYLGPNDRTSTYHVREFTINEFHAHLIEHGFKNIELYGQRQQRVFSYPFFEKHYKRIFKPSRKASPKVEPSKNNLEPQYFVMIGSR
jgi:2-polyprenyl-3-methyl-5-hydroxy-6-metoxy-1,4-benzoquinol methylase